MPYSACAILLLVSISNSTFAATLADLHWMVGSWSGSLGPQTVEEAWSTPRGGTMSTMIRLTSETSTNMVELIVIREENDSLILHLRQFSPALELRLAQDMPLKELSARPSRSQVPRARPSNIWPTATWGRSAWRSTSPPPTTRSSRPA